MDRILKAVDETLKEDCAFVYLLGSAGTERFRDDSDIDLAAFFKTHSGLATLFEKSLQLEKKLQREVQLVALNTVDPIFGRQVLETGRLLFSTDPGSLLQWKTHQMSIYPDFKFSRAIIEKALLNRKRYD